MKSSVQTNSAENTKSDSVADPMQYLKEKQIDFEEKVAIDAIMLTTEAAPNINITKRIEIVTAECAFGMNIFKGLVAGVRDIVGGRSKAVQKTMRDSRRTALYELKKEAHAVGANAVVGIDLDYMELSSGGTMVLLVASGTAVVIEE
ncbi:YbjQ family protein [Amylibacter sp.]|nr:YbjQ family protein [Amylibacter sp.]